MMKRRLASGDLHSGARWEVVFPAVMALVAALLGAVTGSVVTAWSARNDRKVELSEQRDAQARQDRAAAYDAFLAAADSADAADERVWTCAAAQPGSGFSKHCGALVGTADVRIDAMEHTVDGIDIYGTDAAYEAALNVLGALSVDDELSGLPVAPLSSWGQKDPTYVDVRDAFVSQTCLDINPVPRSGCYTINGWTIGP